MSDSHPQVTIIIPCYNCERYVQEAIDSILIQSYTNYEIIVINDGSTDQTSACLENYHNQIRYVYQTNQGVSAARNYGIQLAQGKLVAFLDADDYFLPNKLEAQVAVFETNLDLGIVHSGWRRVDHNGILLADVEPWEEVPELNLESWLLWKPVLPSAMMFRRDWLQQAGGFDPNFPQSEDTELILRLALMGCQAAWLRQLTVCYRQHPESAIYKGLTQARSLVAMIDNFFARSDLPARLQWMEHSVRYSTLVWVGWYLYQRGHSREMVQALQQAGSYCSLSPMETIVDWVESFSKFSQETGEELDADLLTTYLEWQQLMQWLLDRDSQEITTISQTSSF